jgi:hypothetical protein
MHSLAPHPPTRQYVPPFRRPASRNVASNFEAVSAEQDSKRNLDVAGSAGLVDAVDTTRMSEGAFMDYITAQLDAGAIEPWVRFTDTDNAQDEGDIGEHESRFPFLY